MTDIKQALARVRQRIAQAEQKAQRNEASVNLLAVSKRHGVAAIEEAYDAGQRHFGENYCQELLEKIAQLSGRKDIVWHFIGPIQSNKTRDLAEHVDWVHSLDRQKIADRLAKQRPEKMPALNVCIQINIDDEQSKSGVDAREAVAFADYVATLPSLRLRGLMTIPKNSSDSRAAFARMADLFEQIKSRHSWPGWDTLSMGMSADLEAAIVEGATIVRVGTDIFGERS